MTTATPAPGPAPRAAPSAPQVGKPFPSITLLGANDQQVRIPEDFRGRTLVLSFYPWAFSPVCTSEYTGFARAKEEFRHLGAEVVAVSCDHWYTTEAYKASLQAPFHFLSDWSRQASRSLGVLDEAKGRPDREIYLVDREGVLRWHRHYETRACPTLDDFAGELKKLA